ncbi:MAG: ABC transporter ATP-binding protein [Planctomycetota bacterium]
MPEGEEVPGWRERLQHLRFLAGQLQGLRGFLWQAASMILLMAVVNLPLPMLNKVGIDALIPAGDEIGLIALAAFAFLVRAGASGFQIFQNYVVRRVMAGLGHNLRSRMMATMLGGAYSDFVSGAMSERVGRVTTDVLQTERMIFDTISFVIRPLCMILVMLLVMLAIDWHLTLVLFTITPLCIWLYIRIDNNCDELEEEVLAERQELQHQVADCFDNIRAIRCFGREDRYQGRIQAGIDRFASMSVRLTVKRQLLRAAIDIVLLLPWLAIIVAGGLLVHVGEITLGDLMAFSAFEQLLRSPLSQFSWYCTQTRAMAVSVRRVREVCELPPEQADLKQASAVSGSGSSLHLDDIHFAYAGGGQVLRGVSLRLEAGERIAVVGPSGGGKTTLVNLILGFYRPTSGRIILDGLDVEEMPLDERRRRIGCVFQDNPMFDGSVRDNIVLGRDCPDSSIWQALEQSEAGEFVRSLPEGLETRIGVKGLKLSGGQRQRLAIARVLLKDPGIVLLDEATSSLDSVTENRIRSALDRMLAGRSSLTIAHRLSTVVASNRICYLEGGRIIEQGSHAELVRRGGAYARLFATQVDGLLD